MLLASMKSMISRVTSVPFVMMPKSVFGKRFFRIGMIALMCFQYTSGSPPHNSIRFGSPLMISQKRSANSTACRTEVPLRLSVFA